MLNVQLRQDSGTIIRNCNISNFVYKHFIQSNGTQRSLDDVGNGHRSCNIFGTHVLSGRALSIKKHCT